MSVRCKLKWKQKKRTPITTKRGDESLEQHGVNQQQSLEHQMHSNFDFLFNGGMPMEYGHPMCLLRQWESCIFYFEADSTTGIWRRVKGCVAARFSSPSGSWSWKREVQSWGASMTAHQPSKNTTNDRPRGKPRMPSPSVWSLPNSSCSNGELSRLECLELSGVFLLWKQSPVLRFLPRKESKGTKVEWTLRKETYHSCAMIPGQELS